MFQVLFNVLAGQAEEVEKVRVAKHQIGRHPIFVAKRREILLDQLFGLLGDRRALEQQMADLVAEGSNAPALDSAHFGVELAFEAIFERNELDEVAPTQLLRQCRNNSFVRERLGKSHHPREVCLTEATAILTGQFFRQCLKNLSAVFRTVVPEHILSNPFADVPVQSDQGRVHRAGRLLPRRFDQRAKVSQ